MEETHGRRPSPWISWRNSDAKEEGAIDWWREKFLEKPGADRRQVEKEYRDAKARLAAAAQACAEWDRRAGVAPLRKQYERANRAEERAAMRLARTKPATLAGAAALVHYARPDVMGALADWQTIALRAIGTVLTKLNKEAA